MLNSRQITFLLFVLLGFFVLTDSSFEKSLKTKLWSFWGTTVSESTEIGSTAPSSIVEAIESGRISFVDFVASQNGNVLEKIKTSKGPMGIALYILSIILQLIKFLASFVIIFYPIILIMFYFLFTSSLFRNKYDY
jgi:hypothetical protein